MNLSMIKIKIEGNIENPELLEKLYRDNKKDFKNAFHAIYPEIAAHTAAAFWKTRFRYDNSKESKLKINTTDILILIITCSITGILIKFPYIFNINLKNFFFYDKNAALIVFLGLSMYSILTNNLFKKKHLFISIGIFAVLAVYCNMLPSIKSSHSIDLVYIHLPLLLWCVYGLIYMNFEIWDKTKRIDYIKYNGDLAILVAVILLTGMILAGMTIQLFSVINNRIENFYIDYVVVWGLVSVPIIATFIIRKYPSITNKIAPIIARIFSPLVLITLVVYLISILLSGKNLYNDREFLLVFNVMLLGVVAIIVFSISEISTSKKQTFNVLILLVLSIVALIIDLVALFAIVYRLEEYGFTPNRTAVLGANLLIFGNLILITIDLFRVIFHKKEIKQVETTIAKYLPIYALWTIVVVFGFPLLFGIK